MANSTSNLDLVIQSQSGKEIAINALADAASPSTVYGRRQSTTSGLIWGYYGGNIFVNGVSTSFANGTLTLTASSTNYIVYLISTGVISSATTTTNWNSTLYIRLYSVVTDATTITSYTDYRAIPSPDTSYLIHNSIMTAKGSLISATGSGAPVELLVGPNGTTPVANSASSTGISWLNLSSVSSTPATIMYPGTTILQAVNTQNATEIDTMLKTPEFGTQTVNVMNVTVANTPLLDEFFLYDTPLGVTSIPAGQWEFHSFASVDSVLSGRVSTIHQCIFLVEVGTGTLTTTGTGTSRTATASSGTPFLSTDAAVNLIDSSFIRTPTGIHRITGFTSSTVLTIDSLSTYTNETAVAYTIYRHAFGATSIPITSIGTDYQPYQTTYTLTAPISISSTTKLASCVYGQSNNTTTINFVHGGTTLYSHIHTTLVGLHNDLGGLNAGDYQHLTVLEKSDIQQKIYHQVSQSANYTTVLSDAGKHLLHPSADVTARTFTIADNATVAYPIGTMIKFVNQNAAGVLSIAIAGTDVMRLAGAGTTGTRTLAADGIADALKITATEWIISGTSLT